MKLIVAGGRTYSDYNCAKKTLDYFLSKTTEPIEIVSGACDDHKRGVLTFTREDGTKVYGADGLGERYAYEKGYPCKYFPAQWSKHGWGAGPIRNREMAAYCTHSVIFWDGLSKGSRSMYELSVQFKRPTKVVSLKNH